MSTLSNKVDEEIEKLLGNMLAPKSSVDPLMLGGNSIDDVAWVDFFDVRFAIEPHIIEIKNGTSAYFVGPDADTLEKAANVEDQGGDSDAYQEFVLTMQAYIEAGLLRLFEDYWERVLIYSNRWHSYKTHSFSYDAAAGILEILLCDRPFIFFNDSEITYSEQFQIRQLAYWVVRAATESPSMVANLMEIHDAVAATGISVGVFWENLRDFMMTGIDPDINVIISHYANFHEAILNDSSSITSSSYFFATVHWHWPFVVEYLKNRFNAQIIASLEFNAPPVPSDHNFTTFKPYTVNCGLRLVYRQTWRTLGNQRGEVVRTIPLGPKQTEKVSTKIFRRTKISKTAEDLKSTETTTETSDSAKDSSSIMREASSEMKFNLNTSVEGGINIGVFSAKASTEFGMSAQKAEKSGSTQSHLTETMQKMASKVRQETKIVISTESEESFEVTTASEITNPNDEIAITYVYSKLQRQFQVMTQLAEIQDVIMIAEPLPLPQDINAEWVKRYDWILSKALLDDSYRDTLNSITQDPCVNVCTDIAGKFQTNMENTVNHLNTLAGTTGQVSQIDFVAESQKHYRETAEASAEAAKQRYIMQVQRERLFQHIRDNVLYYCRAIYSQEDPQQRALRYRRNKVRVPLDWRLSRFNYSTSGNSPVTWSSVPESEGGRWVDIADAINPAGPIGYYGNFAMYYIRPELRYMADVTHNSNMYIMTSTLFQLVDSYKTPYLAPKYENGKLKFNNKGEPERDPNNIMDPVLFDLIVNYERDGVPVSELTDTVKKEMSQIVPELRLEIAEKKKIDENAPDYIDDINYLKKYFAEYKFLVHQSRLCVIDTNSLMIDLLPGEGSTLEKFKLAHRGMDVLKVMEETHKIELGNARLVEFKKNPEYYDPDKLVVIKDQNIQTTNKAVSVSGAEAVDDTNVPIGSGSQVG